MNEEKNEVIKCALSDLDKGHDLEDVLGLVYDHGRLDAAMQISESDDPESTVEVIKFGILLHSMIAPAVRADA